MAFKLSKQGSIKEQKMKLTNQQLKQIIREELQSVLGEDYGKVWSPEEMIEAIKKHAGQMQRIVPEDRWPEEERLYSDLIKAITRGQDKLSQMKNMADIQDWIGQAVPNEGYKSHPIAVFKQALQGRTPSSW
tara:strand:- start:3517 stop:3912 length:396 start_codon:yes stop_codon:yes gene_type:complete